MNESPRCVLWGHVDAADKNRSNVLGHAIFCPIALTGKLETLKAPEFCSALKDVLSVVISQHFVSGYP
jgi:hypothetical protein